MIIAAAASAHSSEPHPCALAAPAEQGVELGAAHRDGASVRQRDGAARGVHSRDQLALGGKVCLDEQLDLSHARTNALRARKIKQKPLVQSE
jgi:hypothetical protein